MTAKKYLQQCAARTEKFIITKNVILYIYKSNEYIVMEKGILFVLCILVIIIKSTGKEIHVDIWS